MICRLFGHDTVGFIANSAIVYCRRCPATRNLWVEIARGATARPATSLATRLLSFTRGT